MYLRACLCRVWKGLNGLGWSSCHLLISNKCSSIHHVSLYHQRAMVSPIICDKHPCRLCHTIPHHGSSCQWRSKASRIDFQSLTLIEPLDVVRVRVDRNLYVELLQHAKGSYVGTTPSINYQRAHFPLDRASRMEDVLSLSFFVTLKITQGPSQYQQLTFIPLLHNLLLLFLHQSQPSSSSSLLASHSAKEMILLFGHSETMWPRPWHLKHLLVVGGSALSLFCRGWLFVELGSFMGRK